SFPSMIRLPTCSTFPAIRCHRLNIEACVTPPCKSGTKSRVSPQPDSRPGQLSLHQSADNFTVPLAGLQNINWLLLLLYGWFWLIEIRQVKYLNNTIEQDHRFIKKLTRPMKGFKSFQSASATLDGIEVAHMIRKRQFSTSGQSAFQQFAALAA
ncbi:DDE-type integrase/transposase/recombinase, partial [Rhizobium pisi]|uniref:DDE-type integrase/transposase/recombinase n=1 Tax=Rhizobium pisi TaxID=574561 RepID=UPI003D03A68C